MKVERKQKEEWAPIVITLETKEEAQYLWHCLNISRNDVLERSNEDNVPFPHTFYKSDYIIMWEALDQYRDELQ